MEIHLHGHTGVWRTHTFTAQKCQRYQDFLFIFWSSKITKSLALITVYMIKSDGRFSG